MPKRKIKIKGSSLAITKAHLVAEEEFGTTALNIIIQDMLDTVKATKGSAIAAPQIGVLKRIIFLGWDKLKNYPEEPPVSPTIIINPEFKPINNEKLICWEHCLSLPGKRGKTERYNQILFRGFNSEGEKISGKASGIHALVIQHEIDHLDGKCFDERLTEEKLFGDIKPFEEKNIPLTKKIMGADKS